MQATLAAGNTEDPRGIRLQLTRLVIIDIEANLDYILVIDAFA